MKLAVLMLVFGRGKLNVRYCFAFFGPFTTAFQTTHHPDYHSFSWSFVAPQSRFLRHSLTPSPSRKQNLLKGVPLTNAIFYFTSGVCRGIFASIKLGGSKASVKELLNVRAPDGSCRANSTIGWAPATSNVSDFENRRHLVKMIIEPFFSVPSAHRASRQR
jgi:hypothetical protein